MSTNSGKSEMATLSRECNGVTATIFVDGNDDEGWSWWWAAPQSEFSGRMEGRTLSSSSEAVEEAIRDFEWKVK
ncbi:hypothetical protein [Burkholderia stagnalis]|uniref:hypothetical protein n=1 Tax=Burkholderia stagnalis TaxID=1503054 RepID=UPI000F5F87C2|nr:hypothetical protein [Burkholderia stagnalis]